MKKISILLMTYGFFACTESKVNDKVKIPPSDTSEAILEGYIGNVKEVSVIGGNVAVFTANDTWIIKDSMTETVTTSYDAGGNEIRIKNKDKVVYPFSMLYETSISRTTGEKIETTQYFEYDLTKRKYFYLTRSEFTDPYTRNEKTYMISTDTSFLYDETYKYDANYKLISYSYVSHEDSSSSTIDYDYKGDTMYAYAINHENANNDTLRKTEIILEKDEKHNKTKVVNIDNRTGNATITLRAYEYYPPLKK